MAGDVCGATVCATRVHGHTIIVVVGQERMDTHMTKPKKRKCKICKNNFSPSHDNRTNKQQVCSCKCMVTFYDSLKGKGRAVARAMALLIGRRSMAEVRFDAQYIEGRSNVNAVYEKDTFKYIVYETRRYTPDWTLVTKRREHPIYIEYKGVLTVADRKKLKLMKLHHPSIDIRIVFEKPTNKINKGSKTTYAQWARQHGFTYADNCLPPEWLK